MSNQFQNFFSTSFCRRIKTRHKNDRKIHDYNYRSGTSLRPIPPRIFLISSFFDGFFFRIQILNLHTFWLQICRLRNFFKNWKSKQTRENILFTFLTQFWPGTTDGGTELPCLAFRTCSWLWEASVVFKGFFMHIFDIQYLIIIENNCILTFFEIMQYWNYVIRSMYKDIIGTYVCR